ncbi:hypothetical protein F5887DRAFT_831980, partial [Amanita rubescens]
EWRYSEATKRFGSGMVEAYGPYQLITDATIDRIVVCAKAGKLPNVARLITETKWRKDLAEQYGPTILSIIKECFDDQHIPRKRRKKKLPTASSSDVNTVAISDLGTVPARTMRCSACGLTGHNCK